MMAAVTRENGILRVTSERLRRELDAATEKTSSPLQRTLPAPVEEKKEMSAETQRGMAHTWWQYVWHECRRVASIPRSQAEGELVIGHFDTFTKAQVMEITRLKQVKTHLIERSIR